ncbi:MAG: cyclodeaminase/cyclohydrolase family protein [Lachnospiraceae bacterium]|nr:cyclodeaminase/cyclohydrolase family protein [Lachnospiraceae bacterium]
MDLTNLTINDFMALLGSDAPAPGGGSAAALTGALGAALCSMVANLTLGRAKYAEYQELAASVAEKAEALRRALLDAMNEDAASYDGFMAALALPKSTEEEKAARSAAMQEALITSTQSPLHTMELAAEVLKLTRSLVGCSNTNAVSDLAVSALSLKAAMQGAWLNVLINVGSLKDPDKAEYYRARGGRLLAENLALADEIYETVKKEM